MMRGWLFAQRKKRRPKTLSKLSLGVRLELLERRFCMANDVELSLVPNDFNEPPPVVVGYPQASAANVLSEEMRNEVICEVPPTYPSQTLDSELCLDNFAGPRAAPRSFTSESSVAFAQSLFLSADSQVNSVADSLVVESRPVVPVVQQRLVAEGEGSQKPLVPKPPASAEKHPTEPAIAKTVSTEIHAPVRTTAFAMAVDWTTGAKTPAQSDVAIVGLVHEAPREEASIESNVAPSSGTISWTDMLADRELATVGDIPSDTRPQLSGLPGRDTDWTGKPDLQLDHVKKAAHLTSVPTERANNNAAKATFAQAANEWDSTGPAIADSVTDSNEEDSAIVLSEIVVSEIALQESARAGGQQQPKSRQEPRRSRYWLLAAIPAFFVIPRRATEKHLRSVAVRLTLFGSRG